MRTLHANDDEAFERKLLGTHADMSLINIYLNHWAHHHCCWNRTTRLGLQHLDLVRAMMLHQMTVHVGRRAGR